ncbi:MAG: endonuclease/exonuclease/phosphatase family protein [Pseudomonadales bacterium]|nr:endonuclease/exonuclease/phosphatase family protein [Pseudomonadales bacterium]
MLRHQRVALAGRPETAVRQFRLLSFNIQAGSETTAYRHYFTRGGQHGVGRESQELTLRAIADLFEEFDIVALQEIDGGSLRSRFVNQVQYLADHAGFPHWYSQRNRDLGVLGQHGNGVLSRFAPWVVEDHRLPGAIPGRGALVLRFGNEEESLTIVCAHLSLGRRARWLQLEYLAELVSQYENVILMGDLNTSRYQLLRNSPLRDTDLVAPSLNHWTYPSWKPSQALDHILVSSHLRASDGRTLGSVSSDHLPIALNVQIPPTMRLGVEAD